MHSFRWSLRHCLSRFRSLPLMNPFRCRLRHSRKGCNISTSSIPYGIATSMISGFASDIPQASLHALSGGEIAATFRCEPSMKPRASMRRVLVTIPIRRLRESKRQWQGSRLQRRLGLGSQHCQWESLRQFLGASPRRCQGTRLRQCLSAGLLQSKQASPLTRVLASTRVR